ncbi:MAG: branched-chain amino acid transport system II carrier protein [Neisseriaceae bacterium]|nr:MAG: branched-chain amino acid transport system II carrier protein [Neisseriaceae bacterium]
MIRIVFVLGLALFALFFGAGNLIFPIKLGWQSGSSFYPAVIGFLITGVGIPLLGLIASSTSPGGIPEILDKKVSKWFSFLLITSIYLTIGPLFAIPRTATTSYTIGVAPHLQADSNIYLLVFSVIYFLIVLIFSLKPSEMVERIGRFLTPALLLVIGILCTVAFFKLNTTVTELQGSATAYRNPFTEGFTQGYLTMDAIASVTFSIISLTVLRAAGITEKSKILKYSSLAALVSGICLVIVYIGLGWIGNHYPLSTEQLNWITQNEMHEGAYILANASNTLLNTLGPIVVSLIVTLACLTTAIGLTVAISSFFANLLGSYIPKLNYNFCVYFFTLTSLILSNQGLNQVISASIPILNILYPITILIIFIVLFNEVIHIPKIAFQITVITTSLISISNVLFQNMSKQIFTPFYNALGIPISDLTFSWIIPAIITLIIGYLIAYIRRGTDE